MNACCPLYMTQIPKAKFDELLSVLNWKRDGWSNGDKYSLHPSGKDFAFHDIANGKFYADKEYLK